ncbi:hypothetical protein AADZ91_17680 [Colwelliaceae bacterium 6441]
MYKVLLLVLFTFSCSGSDKQPLSIVKAHQELLNQGDLTAALQYWQPSKRQELSGFGFEAVSSMFSGLKLEPSSIKQECVNNKCTVSGDSFKDGELIKVTYTLVNIDDVFYLSNIQSKNTLKTH